MRLTELFDRPAQLQVVSSTPRKRIVRGQLSDGSFLEVDFENPYAPARDRWGIVFMRGKSSSMTDASFDVTGQGLEMEVFSTVVNAVLQFINDVHPQMVYFSSTKTDGNRTSLYSALARKFSRVNGYTVNMIDNGTDDMFKLTRDDVDAIK